MKVLVKHDAGFEVSQDDRVVVVALQRPDVLNALSTPLADALCDVLEPLDQDPGVGAIVVYGEGRAFAAGADISEMKVLDHLSAHRSNFLGSWDRFAALRTPKVAAVGGYALGGGCELAMMCDIIVAAENARFGQPEIKLGLIPGMGGTQRLTRAVGKSLAMELILTGRMMDAEEALRSGLVARVVPDDDLVGEALALARSISQFDKFVSETAREMVNAAFATTIEQGLKEERRMYHAVFGTKPAVEGIAAFVEKRDARFNQ